MKNFLILSILFICSQILFFSCGNDQPISEEKFIKIYANMVIMQDTSSLNQDQVRDKVLSNYKYSLNDYKKTIDFYNSDPERWQKFFDKVVTYVESLKPKTKTRVL